jgi:hypothetical protein
MTPCISILDIEGTPHAACGEKICFQLVKQIHPDNLGIYVNKADGLKAARVLTRAIELCILDAEFSDIERPVTLMLWPNWVILVGSELQKNKEASRAVQMATIEGYAELLWHYGHGAHMQLLLLALLPSLLHVFPTQTQVTLKYLDKTQMKDIRTKSEEFIHKQHIKGDKISS